MNNNSSYISKAGDAAGIISLPCPPSQAALLAQGLEQAGALALQSLQLPLMCPPGNKNIQLCCSGPHQTVEIFISACFFHPGRWEKSPFPPKFNW